jgi:hypothetical protein
MPVGTCWSDWRARWPEAARELDALLTVDAHAETNGKSEGWAQNAARKSIGAQGAFSWRNNVGATKTKEAHQCPKCYFNFIVEKPPIRYGLANDSHQLNEKFKSGDLILAIPRKIEPRHVGTTIAQFGSVEAKKPGWRFNPNDPHQAAQAAWAALVNRLGGFACFSTGDVKL